MKIKFLFDYLSPYAYLGWYKLPVLQQALPNLQIELVPILFPALLNHWGQKGPAEIPPKRNYVFTQCLRYATKENIPFTMPKFHPFNPVTALRLSLIEMSGTRQKDVITALWQASWQQGKDLADENELINVINAIDLPGADLLCKTRLPEIKECLKQNTTIAIAAGVFGIPSYLTEDNTLFWGLDSIPDVIAHLQGRDPIDREKLKQILDTAVGASRI